MAPLSLTGKYFGSGRSTVSASLVAPAIVAALLGAMIGSFLNVVIHRVPAGRSIVRPASACPACGARVRPRDNVPIVSWLLLKGRCRDCDAQVSRRYPIIELVTAAAFAGVTLVMAGAVLDARSVPYALAAVTALVAHLYFASISIALAAIDLDTHRLPDAIVLPSYAVGGALLSIAAIAADDLEGLATAAAGAGILFSLYLTLAMITPRGMGMGDVKLSGLIGLYLGWAGWSAIAVGTLAAFLLGGVLGIILLATRRASRNTGIPFGPWMLGGAWMGIMLGEPIAQGYLAIFGLD